MIDLSKVERDYVRWYPTELSPAFREVDIPADRLAHSARAHRPKGLYVHIPWCDVKCSFCNYNVLIRDRADRSTWAAVDKYLDLIIEQAARYASAPWFKDTQIDSLYIGGGTPSFLDSTRLFKLVEGVKRVFGFTPEAEISVEGNPISIDLERITALKEVGTTRLSIGVQSFDDALLKVLGRGVTRDQNIKALELARASGIRVINIDLIYRNPTQTTAEVSDSISTAIRLGANQVSLYPLWVRPKTEFSAKLRNENLTLPTEEDEFNQLILAQEMFRRAGYRQYNVFDFVDSAENECINTYHQWGDGEWLGIGPAATSYINGAFFIQKYDTRDYVSAIENREDAIDLGVAIDIVERQRRTMIFGLRMFPFQDSRFIAQYGVSAFDVFPREIEFLANAGLADVSGEEVRLTPRGIFHINGISKMFYSPNRASSLQVIGRRRDGSIILEKDY